MISNLLDVSIPSIEAHSLRKCLLGAQHLSPRQDNDPQSIVIGFYSSLVPASPDVGNEKLPQLDCFLFPA